MQYKVGTVTTNGTNQVTGSGTAWATNAAIGDLFWIQGQNAPYYIGNVNSDGLITLTSVFAGPNAAGQSYVIARSFTANQKFPYPESTDIDTHTVVKRAMTMLDTMVGAAIGTSGQANRVVYTDANGNLTTSAALAFDGTSLTVDQSANVAGIHRFGKSPTGDGSQAIVLNGTNAQKGWAISNSRLAQGHLEFIRMTAAGGDTIGSSADFKLDTSGNATFAGTMAGTSATFSSKVSGVDSGLNPAANVLAAFVASGSFGGGYILADGTGRAGMWTKSSGAELHLKSGGTSGGFSSDVGYVVIATSSATVTVNGVSGTAALRPLPGSASDRAITAEQGSASATTDGNIYSFVNTSAGTGFNHFAGQSSGSVVFKVLGNGNVQNTNNSYGAISDARFKRDVQDAGTQWADTLAMRLRKFGVVDAEGNVSHRQIGLVAQELAKTSPGLVMFTREGAVMKAGIQYSVINMKMLGALQELMWRFEDMQQWAVARGYTPPAVQQFEQRFLKAA